MDLYHIHILGNHDILYTEGNEFIVDKKMFKNRLYDRAMKSNLTVSCSDYKNTINVLKLIYLSNGYNFDKQIINLNEVIATFLNAGTKENQIQMLNDAGNILFNAAQAKRELSIEAYRKDKVPDKPSRMHSLFACTESGIEYWENELGKINNYEIFSIETFDEPFATNAQLLPPEESSYLDSYNGAMRYFKPRNRDLNGVNDEFLVQGKVKLKEKVYEYKNI